MTDAPPAAPPDAPKALCLRFDASTHPDPHARTEAWREAMSLSVDVAFTSDQREVFAGSLAFHPLGPAILVEARCTPHTMIRDAGTIARSGDAHVLLDLFSEGGFTGTFGERSLRVGPGDGFLMDFRRTLRLDLTADSRFVGFVLPRALFEALAGGSRAMHGLHWPAGGAEMLLLGPLLEALAAQALGLSAARAAALGPAVAGVIVACLAKPGHSAHRRGGAGRPRSPDLDAGAFLPAAVRPDLAQLHRHIARHAAASDFDPDALGRAFGLSRSRLYRLFAAEGGVARVIRRRRAGIARDLMAEAEGATRPVAEIARASGFADARVLRRALREMFDTTPSQLRRAGAGTRENAEDGPEAEPARAIGALFDATTR